MRISYTNLAGLRRLGILAAALCFSALSAPLLLAQTTAAPPRPKVVVDPDGIVHVPAQAVPMSAYLSPEAKAYVTHHLEYMQNPYLNVQVNGLPRYMEPYLERQRILYPTQREDSKIGGVHVYIYTPKAGSSEKNQDRALIELHGGGFSGCWPGCAELESIPISSLGSIKVVAVDYREGPKYKFPAASEDVASVYKEMLKTYRPENIGIYGCSAGGGLTAMSIAWFEKHDLPIPGAIGIYCAGAGSPKGVGFMAGDSAYTAIPLGEAHLATTFGPAPPKKGQPPVLGYFAGTDRADPLVNPAASTEVLEKFPPTLIITGTRDFALSGALYRPPRRARNLGPR